MSFWGSTNKHHFTFGPFETRQDAIGAVIAASNNPPARIYTGEQIEIPLSIDGGNLLEAIRRTYGLDPDWGLLHDEAEEELTKNLNKTLKTWLRKWDVEGIVVRIDKVVAHEGGLS